MSRKSRTLFQRSLLGSTIIAGILCTSPAYAQEQAAQTNEEQAAEVQQELAPASEPEEDARDIVVTGTRIVSPNITSLAPIQVIGETEIDQSGALNIQEVLLKNPVFGTPALSRTNSAFLTSGAGGATVDLRDLGSDRTLVLINSRRVVAGFPGTATVDLNMIPTQFIEKVDILTGNASSLYGSDAIAGVVNFIYKRNFQGLLAEGQYGITSRGDSGNYQLSLTGGGNFADDRGNVMVYLGYTKEKGLLSRQRKGSQIDNVSRFWYVTGDPDDYDVMQVPFLSSFAPQGRFDVNGTATTADDFTYSPAGVLQPCFTTNGATCGGGAGVGPNGFNRQHFRTLAVPVERYLLATRGTFEITDSISAFMEGTYAKTTSSREIEPFATDSSDVYPVNARMPIQTLVNGVPVLNPFVPAAIAAAAQDTDGDGLLDIAYARRLSEVGTRNSHSTRDIYRFVVGLEGQILDDKFNWDLSYNYGQTSEQQTSNGQYNVVNARFALAAIPDGFGGVMCADEIARAQGCQPLNLFGFDSISPEALNYIKAKQSLSTKVSQQVWSANVSGSPFDLPAGPVGIAVGAEYRKETSSEEWDALTNAGLNAGNALPDTSGSFNVKEVYGELEVPILSEKPFFYDLRARGAIRFSDYSTVGSVTTWSAGGEWFPIQDFHFRGTYAKAVRAPNIGELFTGPSQTFPTGLQDPCEGITLADAGTTLGDQCLAAPGVTQNIADSGGAFTVTQADQQGISGFNSGNPNLGVENSRSITFGGVFAPRSIPAIKNLVLSVDYWNIKIDDAIINPSRTTILTQCYDEGNDEFCQFVVRRPTVTGSNSAGSIEFVNSGAVNAAALKVAGIDTVAQYSTNLDRFLNGWNLSARLSWTHLLKGYSIDLPGAPKDVFAGEIGDAKNRWNGAIALNSDKWGVSFTGTYIGKSYEDDASLAAFDLGPKAIKIDPQFYLASQLTFTPARQYEFYLGVNNLLDNKAPLILQGSVFNVTGAITAADVYDIFGRSYYAGVRLRF